MKKLLLMLLPLTMLVSCGGNKKPDPPEPVVYNHKIILKNDIFFPDAGAYRFTDSLGNDITKKEYNAGDKITIVFHIADDWVEYCEIPTSKQEITVNKVVYVGQQLTIGEEFTDFIYKASGELSFVAPDCDLIITDAKPIYTNYPVLITDSFNTMVALPSPFIREEVEVEGGGKIVAYLGKMSVSRPTIGFDIQPISDKYKLPTKFYNEQEIFEDPTLFSDNYVMGCKGFTFESGHLQINEIEPTSSVYPFVMVNVVLPEVQP